MSSVKVAVRVRPFNQREIANGSRCIIGMNGTTTNVHMASEIPYDRIFEFNATLKAPSKSPSNAILTEVNSN
ncbi:hypothetical protein ANCDUO_22490 [Ancylostoma duodenale]|uniref:Kinesin motor domain-containing protein n=1 Tax=Ancylostoma duodenale TaxID=51022 RepID=A0A0C2FRD0_9BILA|nr:hypothetical protein ANCDUO_22490 [Ancylostoma duodenale]